MTVRVTDPEPWLDKRELARHLGISVRSVERALADGMPHARIFTRVRFQVTAVEAWLEQCGRLERHNGIGPTMGANTNGPAARERPGPDTEGANFNAPQA